jgi:hypothetical protein
VITCSCEYRVNTGIYNFSVNKDGYLALWLDNSYVVRGIITDFSYDSVFILVEQNPVDSICQCNYDCFSQKEYYNNGRGEVDSCKRAIKESVFRQYWIIKKYAGTIEQYRSEKSLNDGKPWQQIVWGPFKKEVYQQNAQ